MALQDQMSHLTKVMEENLGGIRVVRAFAAHAYEMARFDESSGKALAIAARRVRLFVHSTTQMSFVYFLAMAATLWVDRPHAPPSLCPLIHALSAAFPTAGA